MPNASAEETGESLYQVAIATGAHDLLADEPVDLGGQDTGPSPFDLLCAALAACTTMTLRMYAQRHGIALGTVCTQVVHSRNPEASPPDVFTRHIRIAGDWDAQWADRLLGIANRCPVHKTLVGGAQVETVLGAA